MTIDDEVHEVILADELTRHAHRILGEHEAEPRRALADEFLAAALLADFNDGHRRRHYARSAAIAGSRMLDENDLGPNTAYVITQLTNTYLAQAGLDELPADDRNEH